ncbi:hypothetical protein VNI00_001904 [Paramarasmius palmivorus]|uniref:Uncharacterized protein n=1 Tax=Paramarasmius palmivorus TaxID=297713 RepID=A0AAW0E2E4_9AGAR
MLAFSRFLVAFVFTLFFHLAVSSSVPAVSCPHQDPPKDIVHNTGIIDCGILEVASGNAGDGGDASSRVAPVGKAVQRRNSNINQDAGPGGSANGRSVYNNGYCEPLIRVLSDNAGNGGNAGSSVLGGI